MDKINKNPEKIKKMADKHRGMKRSEEARANISASKKGCASNTKGKTTIYEILNPTNIKYVMPDFVLPEGWAFGRLTGRGVRGKLYNNGIVAKVFKEDEIPEGWVAGRLKTK